MKRILCVVLSMALLLTMAACGGTSSGSSSDPSSSTSSSSGGSDSSESSASDDSSAADTGRWDALRTTEEKLELYLHLADLTPTVNTEPTEENPRVFNSTRLLAEAWTESLPNDVEVNFVQVDMSDNFWEWCITSYTAGTGPDLLYIWGDKELADQGWYLYLDDVIESPNYYEPGNERWRDMYPDYIWLPGTSYIYDDYDRVIGMPILIGPGPLTAYYYNESIFDELGLAPTSDWDEFIEMCKTIKEAGYTAVAPSQYCLTPGFATWDASFSITPVYGKIWIDDNDLNGDGALSSQEQLRATYNGYYYLENNPGLIEAYETILEKFLVVLDEGAENIDYTQPWREGKVAMLERQLAEMPTIASDTDLTFSWSMFPPPVKQNSEYVVKVEYTESGPFNPEPSFVPNVMNPEIQDRPDCTADYVVDFLKYLTATNNLNVVVEELAGAHLGATKSCQVPAVLADWLKLSFPILPTGVSRPARPNLIPSNSDTYIAYLDMVAKGMMTMEEFIPLHDELMYKDLLMYMEQEGENLDTSDWGEIVVPSCVAQS